MKNVFGTFRIMAPSHTNLLAATGGKSDISAETYPREGPLDTCANCVYVLVRPIFHTVDPLLTFSITIVALECFEVGNRHLLPRTMITAEIEVDVEFFW